MATEEQFASGWCGAALIPAQGRKDWANLSRGNCVYVLCSRKPIGCIEFKLPLDAGTELGTFVTRKCLAGTSFFQWSLHKET